MKPSSMLSEFRLNQSLKVLNPKDIMNIDSMHVIDSFKIALPMIKIKELSPFHDGTRNINVMHDNVIDMCEHIDEICNSLTKGVSVKRNALSPKDTSFYDWCSSSNNKLGLSTQEAVMAHLDEQLSKLIRTCISTNKADNSIGRILYPVAFDLIKLTRELTAE